MASTSPSGTKSKTTTWLIAGGVGCAVLALTSVCCLALALILFNRDPKTTGGERIGTIAVGSAGGVFEDEQVTIRISPGIAREEIRLEVYREGSQPGYLEEGEESGAAYSLSGPLEELNGEITFSVALSEEELAAARDGSGGLVKEEMGYATSAGEALHVLALPTTVDRESGTATAALRFEGGGAAGALPRTGAAALLHVLSSALALQEAPAQQISVRYLPGLIYDAYRSDHFQVSFIRKLHDSASALAAVQILEEQYQKISDLGFLFNPGERINVTVMYLEGAAGLFVADMRGSAYTVIQLNSKYFRGGGSFDQQELAATIGHELMHLAQFSMDPRYAYTKSRFPGPVLWMDEAIATWYEPLALGDPAYIPQNANRNVNFVSQPLLSPTADRSQAQDHGYGASFFIQFLTRKYGDQLPGEIYQQIADGAGTASEALELALRPYAAELDLEWREFIQVYFSDPAFFHNPNAPDIATITMKAENGAQAGVYNTQFEPGSSMRPRVVDRIDGTLPTGKSVTIQVEYTQPAMTASGFVLGISGSDGSQQAFYSPGYVTIATDARKGSGVIVMAYDEGAQAYYPLAGAPYGFISAGDPNSNNGHQYTLDHFGPAAGGGWHQRLLILPFNHHADPTDPGDPIPMTIQIQYWGQGIAPTAEPPSLDAWPTETPFVILDEPTPPPASSHACQGMTLEKMKTPLGRASNCWRACFAIGSGDRSDAEIQECIDNNQ